MVRSAKLILSIVAASALLADAHAQQTRPAGEDEVRALCTAIARIEAVTYLDQALDLARCLQSAMTVQAGPNGATISGVVTVNFPNHSQRETCHARLASGRVDPATIGCR